jgi:hypothetical protein
MQPNPPLGTTRSYPTSTADIDNERFVDIAPAKKVHQRQKRTAQTGPHRIASIEQTSFTTQYRAHPDATSFQPQLFAHMSSHQQQISKPFSEHLHGRKHCKQKAVRRRVSEIAKKLRNVPRLPPTKSSESTRD